MRTYAVLLLPDAKAGGFTVEVPALPGVVTEGDTREQALANAREAISLFLEDLMADGEAIPTQTMRPELADVAVDLSSEFRDDPRNDTRQGEIVTSASPATSFSIRSEGMR